MNARELEARLLREGFPPDSFSVEGTWLEDAIVLSHDGKLWRVKYIERGEARELGRFPTEESACAVMYEEMLKGWPLELRAEAKKLRGE